ncbi:uncharacterized protein C8A04DRAFT_38957 [Dichotomopilus funicola]|uniref:LicD/FKTN/FKRP nucleotidyltransferase domain-containing protein n=1 Tax=Dichotomopilus funicola TaxID=1934379 RepID=A0AAN6ZJH8_9PEZI|nr:hypothetical protein C8A04DRAFT_38957 [Dichotomopilus funicola]
MVRAYLSTFNELGIETWLAHDSLLGWWLSGQVLPGDRDVRMQVSEPGIFDLAAYYNMTTFSIRVPGQPKSVRRKYQLELSRFAKAREQSDPAGSADGRWIDTDTGLYIDMYAVRYNLTHPGGRGMMSCKDGGEFRDKDLFPLQKTSFEGVPAKIPHQTRELLVAEYGARALKAGGRNG